MATQNLNVKPSKSREGLHGQGRASSKPQSQPPQITGMANSDLNGQVMQSESGQTANLRKPYHSPVKKGKMAVTPTSATTFDKLAKATGIHANASHEKKLEKDKDLIPSGGSALKTREIDKSETRLKEKSENRKKEKPV